MTMAYLIDSKIALKKTGDAITILKLTSNIDLLSHQYHQHPNPNNPPTPLLLPPTTPLITKQTPTTCPVGI